jgi:uncharacterized protein
VTEFCFACDAMLGKLARWLRFAGFDTRYAAPIPDLTLAGVARAEGRWLLTRDHRLASLSGPRVVLLHADSLAGQVAELRVRLPLHAQPQGFFSRCSACNGPLGDISREYVQDLVPPYVAAHASRFRRCPDCGRVYWPGTHTGRIESRLRALFLAEG